MGILKAGIGGALAGSAIGGYVGATSGKKPWEDYSDAILGGAAWGAGIGGVGGAAAWGIGRSAIRKGKRWGKAADDYFAGPKPEETPMNTLEAKLAAKKERKRGRLFKAAGRRKRRIERSPRRQAKMPIYATAPGGGRININRQDKGAFGRAVRRGKAAGRLLRRKLKNRSKRRAVLGDINMPFPSGTRTASAEPAWARRRGGGLNDDWFINENPTPMARPTEAVPAKAGGYGPANPISRGQQLKTRMDDFVRGAKGEQPLERFLDEAGFSPSPIAASSAVDNWFRKMYYG